MSLWNRAFAAVACVAMLGCGSSEPDSPLILGKDPGDAARGMRTLTAAQGRALQNVVMSAGAPCDAVEHAYLRDIDAGQSESWDVRCPSGAYSVNVYADGTAPDVQRCFGWFAEGCVDPYSRRRFRQYPDQRAPAGELNPDLGKLLEQMESTDKKAD